MARISARTLQSKNIKASKVASFVVNTKHLGDEPVLSAVAPVKDLDYTKALTWYNYLCSVGDARGYLQTYLKANGRAGEIKTLAKVPDNRFPIHAGWIARMLARGANLPQRSRDTLEKKLQEAYAFVEPVVEVKKAKPVEVKTSVQDRINDKVSDFIGEFEEALDKSGFTLSMYEWLTKHQLPPVMAGKVAEFFRPMAEEADALLQKKCDPQLKEGFASWTPAKIKARAAFYAGILSDCKRYADNTKKQKVVRTRKKKAVPAEKQLKGLKYQKECKDYKVASINPEKILGASELWTFNTKYRLLTVFYAVDTLSIAGTTIKGYDEERSKTFRIGRKTEECIETILRGGKRAVTKMLSELKTITTQHRINENTVLLKAA
jgi:hypothetical protein